MKAPKQTDIIEQQEPVVEVERGYNPSQFSPTHGQVLSLFPTNMFRGQLVLDMEQVKEDIRRLVSKVREIEGEDRARNYTTYFIDEIREEMYELDWYKEFSDRIKDTYVEFCANIYGHELDYLNRHDIHLFSWASVYKGEHAHEVHNHVDSFISGTWYITTNEDTAPIKFLNPNLMATFQHTSKDKYHGREGFDNMMFMGTDWLENEVHFHPRETEFLLWPSYMQHMVPVQTLPVSNDYERISLSFNLKHRLNINSNDTGNDMSYRGLV